MGFIIFDGEMIMAKVVVGLSGGVDSAVCAYLLKKEGYEVIGVTLNMQRCEEASYAEDDEKDDALRVAKSLDIPFYRIDCGKEFHDKVSSPFVKGYISGFTPSPCIECNRYVKWQRLIDHADQIGAEYVATGHYSRIIKLDNGRYTVKKAVNTKKDQTYMLYKLTQEQLARTLMPLGEFDKEEVREIAKQAGIPVADKADSQEICFVTDGHYSDYVRENAGFEIDDSGYFTDPEGNILGKHKGIINYTVGQRKGL
nr:tRNA 2-thiouridine(34) synthase MnmA [Lachnospiraceae bacterium]